MNRFSYQILAMILGLGLIVGCSSDKQTDTDPPGTDSGAVVDSDTDSNTTDNATTDLSEEGADTEPVVDEAEEKGPTTEVEWHAAFAAKNPKYTGKGQFFMQGGLLMGASLAECQVADISPLAGSRLIELDLSLNPLSDISPLKGMPLQRLFLEKTQVSDLSPVKGAPLMDIYVSDSPVDDVAALSGMPLTQVHLIRTKVRDISALKGAPLESAWFNDSPVESFAALEGAPVVSLTLKGTKISDLSPVKNMPRLERLHIGRTAVTDLSPLEGSRLTRLVFTPARVTKGIDIAKGLSLGEIGTEFGEGPKDLLPPVQFWPKYDNGAFK